ncbi:unnamed protein product [Coregonus sp. 'balchen']|nr:unnamed protein product [Coregonus sp. 'balchen']
MQGEDYEDFEEEQPQNCSIAEQIRGGNVSYSQAGTEGSVLTYHCKAGYYPYPISQRVCSADGEWSTMRLANGRRVSRASCKGESQSFSCHNGFTLSGSAQRNCTSLGDWIGTIPVSDDCKNPGVPPGALRSEGRFRKGEKVQYRCQMGLDLLGSAERVCLESKEWSGSETRCQAQYAFDSPSAVAEAMGGSLSGVMDVLSPEFIKKNKGPCGWLMVLDSYEVELKFQVISYASQAKDIVDIVSSKDERASSNVQSVLKRLAAFDHKSHGVQTGTNLYAALHRVYERMAILKERNETRFSETQNVILIETDGYSNTGGSPLVVLAKIRSLLGYSTSALDHTEDKLLGDKSVIMCGVAQEDVSENQEEFGLTKIAYTRPWHRPVHLGGSGRQVLPAGDDFDQEGVVVQTGAKSETCQGSIVTQSWILTAAHCFSAFRFEGKVDQEKVTVKHGKQVAKVLSVIPHPQYNIDGLRDKNVKEFYDYDVALVKVEKIKLSWTARPICLPCTKPANRALKMSPTSKCEHHSDSGGALFLLNRLRYFQVGVVSWGTKNVCEPQDISDRPPPDARDFHVSVFHLLPWLKQHLGNELEFLPMDD